MTSAPTARVLLIRNPRARSGQDGSAEDLLRQRGMAVLARDSCDPGDCAELIREHRDRVDLVVVGGGDGTINSAAPGLIETGLPLGILPLGTANDLARTLGIGAGLADAVAVIAGGVPHRIDVGEVNGHFFFNAASIGLGAELTRRLTGEVKRRWGVLGYARTMVDAWRARRSFAARVRVSAQEELRLRSVQITVGNGRHYGGGMTVARSAAVDDAALDLYSLPPLRTAELLLLAPLLRFGLHDRWERVEVLRARELAIETWPPMAVTADGERIGRTPVRFRVHEAAVTVLVPQTYLEVRDQGEATRSA
jgi:YegS/Rv2252/BmrU family lipid kinase